MNHPFTLGEVIGLCVVGLIFALYDGFAFTYRYWWAVSLIVLLWLGWKFTA